MQRRLVAGVLGGIVGNVFQGMREGAEVDRGMAENGVDRAWEQVGMAAESAAISEPCSQAVDPDMGLLSSMPTK